MTKKQRLSLNAQIRARGYAQGYAAGLLAGAAEAKEQQREKEKREREELNQMYLEDQKREKAHREAAFKENQRALAEYDQIVGSITREEQALFQASPAYLKYQQYRRTLGEKKRVHRLSNGAWRAP